MDFGSLIYAAHKNEKTANKEVKYYTTKFEPPKKEIKSKTSLSVNVQKYLQKREEEERRKVEEEKKKKEELLALRSQDRKAFKRVQTMLKRTKSANKSVMEDAIDDVNTVVTMAGPKQCDEDDYGYVSQEASAYYAKLMDKYASMPPEEPKFPQGKKPVVKDLNAAKDRVKAALLKQEEEEMMPHKRKRKSKADKLAEESGEGEFERERSTSPLRSRDPSPVEHSKPKKPKKMAPPPMDFSSLLKLAEQKQFEPIKIEKKVEEDEDKRPMTKKQRLEYERERERIERKMEREKARNGQRRPDSLNRIPKVSERGERNDKPSGLERIPKVSERGERNEKPNGLERIPKVSERGERNEKPNGLERIPKKTSSESKHKSVSFSEGPRRKDSIDSDSNSRTNSDNERPRNQSQYNKSDRFVSSNQSDSDRPGSNYQSDSDHIRNNHHKNREHIKRHEERRPFKPTQTSVAENKIKSRTHNISDDEQFEVSDHRHERSQSNNYRPQHNPDRNTSLKQVTAPKMSKDSSRSYSERNNNDERYANSSDNEYSDSQSGSDSKKYYAESTVYKNRPEKYKPEKRSQSPSDSEPDDRKSKKYYAESTVYKNRQEKRSQSPSDSEPDDRKSKKYYAESTVYKNRPEKYKPEKRSQSPSDSEPDDRKIYEPPKKQTASWSKEKKIKTLFAGSDDEDSDNGNPVRRNEIETKKPMPSPSCKLDRSKNISETKFRIPKENSKPQLNKTNMNEITEKRRSSENNKCISSSSSKSQINKDPGKHTSNNSHHDRPSSKPIMDKGRPAVDKNIEKSRPSNVPPKIDSSSENIKQLTLQNAEETLKKSGSVWSKPCNLPPPKPNSGLSESQIQRLREMNKKPTPISSKPVEGRFRETFLENKSLSKPIPRDERQLPPRTLQGKPSLLKAAAAAAASRASSQKSQSSTTSRDLERQPPSKSSERPPSKSSERPPSKSLERPPSKSVDRPPSKSVDRPQSKSLERTQSKPLERPPSKSSERPPSKTSERPLSKSSDRQPPPKSSSTPSKQRELTSKDSRPKQFPPSDLKPKQFPPNDLKPRQFPPKDVRGRQFPPSDVKRKPKPRRIETDSEDDYDSEMDDFIDRGDDLDDEEISREIQSIFGYDKSRYAGLDDDDDECMESNFGQIDKEEMTSLRIGAIEDYKELMKEKKERDRKRKRKLEMMRMMKERR